MAMTLPSSCTVLTGVTADVDAIVNVVCKDRCCDNSSMNHVKLQEDNEVQKMMQML
jgi:hypothetical protein